MPESRDRLREPSLRRLRPDAPHRALIIDAHNRALADGATGYLDPATGLFVMTARTLQQRGFCCRTGCRHCPYVP